jgi:hypothetical protein
MVHVTVEDAIASFPYPILPTLQGGADYHGIHSIRKLLRKNAQSIESHLGGGAVGHIGIIVSIATYAGRSAQRDSWGYRGCTMTL